MENLSPRCGFKPFLRNTDNFHKYYNNLISLNRIPSLNQSQFFKSLSSIKNIENNNDNKKSINNDSIFKQNKINKNLSTIFNRNSNNKIRIKPFIKEKMICKDILTKCKSSLFFNFNKNSKISFSKKILRNSDLNASDGEKTSLSYIINFFNDYEKEFFPDIDYSNLNYNEYEIYKDKYIYENLIKDKINYFKNNENENRTIKLEKNFHYGKNKNEIKLTLDSLYITFKEMSTSNNLNDSIFKFNFPFSLLPIFYYKGFETFIKFLSAIIKIENNFEKIIFQEEKIIEALNNIKDFQTPKNEDVEKEKLNNFLNDLKIKKEKHTDLRPPILKRNKNFLKFNKFIFFWITNSKTYIVTIILPCIHLNILENKILINHFIDYELLFYLYKRNFLNWDYFIIKYLSGYAKFRNIFQKLGSNININNISFFLKEPKTKINSFSEEILINIYTDLFNKNQIIQFKSFFIIVNLIDLHFHQRKIYHIYFNFYQYVKLYEISKYASKIFFLIKFLEINCEMHTLNFNFKEFDEFNIRDWMSNIKKFSDVSLKKRTSNEKLYREFDLFSKRIEVTFKKPGWSIIRLEDKKEDIRTWEIGKELEKEFINSIIDSGSDSWTNLLNGCLKRLNEPVPILPKISKKNHRKKLNLYYNDSSLNIRKSNSRFSKA